MSIIMLKTEHCPFMDEHEFKNEGLQKHRWYYKFENDYGARVSADSFVAYTDLSHIKPFSLSLIDYEGCKNLTAFDVNATQVLREFSNLSENDVNQLLTTIKNLKR